MKNSKPQYVNNIILEAGRGLLRSNDWRKIKADPKVTALKILSISSVLETKNLDLYRPKNKNKTAQKMVSSPEARKIELFDMGIIESIIPVLYFRK